MAFPVFMRIDLYLVILVVGADIRNPTVELAMHTVTPTNETREESEAQPLPS